MNFHKYKPFPVIDLPNREWPSKSITKAPDWCSVDLRDGNQSLIIPMNLDQKLKMFKMLCDVGFKEIEIGFPSASEVEFEFCRKLIEEDLIPDGVAIQVLVQAREHLIKRTYEALEGCKAAIVHVYNSTSTIQRKVVFNKGMQEIKDIAIQGAQWVVDYAQKTPGNYRFQYSPESFSLTEMDYALDVCEAVLDVFNATAENPLILNLPVTVEGASANIHADQIEWFCKNLKDRSRAIISLHNHNDRGTAVAAAELSLMAGADRVEGTLFGNGERTGNLDLLTMALNMFSQGVDPELDFSDVNHIKNIYTSCTKMSVHERHPYVGDLVYTAFSGSHQDAINKGMKFVRENDLEFWEVPYLPIDPKDVGRCYESIIRINSQSGKGGVAYIMETEYGFSMPKAMHVDFGKVIQNYTDRAGQEANPEAIFAQFKDVYLDSITPYTLHSCSINTKAVDVSGDNDLETTEISAVISKDGDIFELYGKGNGPIEAFAKAFNAKFEKTYSVKTYGEHAIGEGSDTKAVTYIGLVGGKVFSEVFGAGVDSNITLASVKSFISAVNRLETIK